jgi:hypothetical protein
MIVEFARTIVRAHSMHRAMALLSRVPMHIMLVMPCTRRALAFARLLCLTRQCFVTGGAVSSAPQWKLQPHLRTPTEIATAFAGQNELLRTVVSFPEQHQSRGPGCVRIPFAGSRYTFSAFEALLVARHRPPVYALASGSPLEDFSLRQVQYEELFAPDGRLLSLPGLIRRLLMHLEQEVAQPPHDWLGQEHLELKSEVMQWVQVREQLKDVECLLRMHLQTRCCDRVRTAAAIAAVSGRRRLCTASSAE